ncbi:diaminopimelate decarboxylase [Capillimicrobium parvum]|uniref:Diaminopimelate decarboxylase n=1 Tax=Capillimicrobium parvum TaxID=2884022 RepID=A0A9E6Y0I2_9ACTN|nr:diaminopimelate decarboxylase [Capillimicrobium parvum]UGS37854.1 Diaminopimelate decarboxylase [Capillimicrobium parvum]
MAVTQQLSPAYPQPSRLDERGVLEIGGCDALELAREFGTPAYVVSEDDLRGRARAMLAAYGARAERFEVVFASKAFPCTAVYRVFAEEGLGCDVASGGELAMALAAGFDPARIYFHGNAKSVGELRAALDARVGTIVVDNGDEIARLEALLGGRTQRVLLRVTPDVRGETHAAISTGQADSKFGVSMADAPAAIARLQAAPGLDLAGLHFHIGSQLLDVVPYLRAVAAVAELGDFPIVNVGGGLGAAYTDERPPSIEEYVAAKVDAVQAHLGLDRVIVDEPGRALVANSTVTLYTVQSVKRNVSTWVGVDGGMSDNLRPMLYGARYEVQVADRFGGDVLCHVAGKHCESGDVIARDVMLDDPRPGDVLVTPATGAYGHALANNYNGVPRPPVVFVKDGDARLVVRRETSEDLLARDV